MKQINNYIFEKLHLNKNLNTNTYNPDNLTNEVRVLYDDHDIDEDTADQTWDACKAFFKNLNNKHDLFILLNTNKISELTVKNVIDSMLEYDIKINMILYGIVDGSDDNYIVQIENGHIKIQCENLSTTSMFYIYAINKNISNDVSDFIDAVKTHDNIADSIKEEFIQLLNMPQNIEPIKYHV